MTKIKNGFRRHSPSVTMFKRCHLEPSLCLDLTLHTEVLHGFLVSDVAKGLFIWIIDLVTGLLHRA